MSQDSGRRGVPSEPDPRVSELLPGLPRVAALDALLRDVDRLRLGLETDLTLAASAVDAGAHEVARDLVEDDLREVRAFEARAVAHLERLASAERSAVAAAGPPAAVLQLQGRRRRRITRLLPAAPLAAAAAVAGFLLLSPQTGAPAPETAAVPAALATAAELERLSQQGAPPEALEQAAQELNAEIATLVARAEGDPAAARQALDLLRRSQAALHAAADPQALGEVLAQSQRLAARLLATLPPVAPSTVPPVSLPPLPVPTQQVPSPPAPRTEVLPTDLPPAPAAPARTPAARPVPPQPARQPAQQPARPQEPAQQEPAPRPAAQSARPSARPAPAPPVTDPLAPGAGARSSTTLPLGPG